MLPPSSRALRMHFIAPVIAATLVATACGGAPAKTSSDLAPAESRPSTANADASAVGNAFVAEGGVSVLGTMPLTSNATTLGPPLMARALAKGEAVKLDGLLREWPARSAARVNLRGNGYATLEGAVQYDDQFVYIALDIHAPSYERTQNRKATEDHAELSIAFPTPKGFAAYDLGLFAGKAGVVAGNVQWLSGAKAGSEVAGAGLVEAEVKANPGLELTIEAKIPWGAFPEASETRLGLRGALRYVDASGAGQIVGTGKGNAASPNELPQLFTEPEIAVSEGLLLPRGLNGTAPLADIFANVAGDSAKERIAIYGHFLTVCGPRYREGKQFFFREYPGTIVTLEARRLSDAARDDLILRRRIDVAGTTREILEILSFQGEEPKVIFAHEIAIAAGEKRVSNTLRIKGNTIEVLTEPALGYNALSFREGPLNDIPNILLPWGPFKTRRFEFKNGTYAVKEEVPNPDVATNFPARDGVQKASPMPTDVPTPQVSAGSDVPNVARIEAAYRIDRNIAASERPKVDLAVNVAEDSRAERVVLFGRELVVMGAGFRGGARYETINLTQFESPAEIESVTARDLTGDGNAELIVRGTMHPTSNAATAKGPIAAQVLLAYEVSPSGIKRIFGIETGRSLGDKRVQALVQFMPAKSGRGFDIQAASSMAKGFTARDYPWPVDKPTAEGMQPLLVPWSSPNSVHYAWDGSHFAPLP